MDKIIIVHYIDIRELNYDRAVETIRRVSQTLPKDEGILSYVIPVQRETSIECINPKLVSEEDFQKAKEVLDNNQKIVDEIVSRQSI